MENAVNATHPQTARAGGASRDSIRRIPPELLDSAVGALLGVDERAHAARRRFIGGARRSGLDLGLTWGRVREGRSGAVVDPVCLAVLGMGRIAMLFVSPPRVGCGPEPAGTDRLRGEVVTRVLEELPLAASDPPTIAQALPAGGETWASRAYARAGMTRITRLISLRRPLPARGDASPADIEGMDWGSGVRVRPVSDPESSPSDGALLVSALERTYEETLDCPELCGLRRVEDVLASHRDTPEFDPSLWWLVEAEGEPEGCLLLNRDREREGVELVYLGLSPRLRGRGLAERLLRPALRIASARGARAMTCAVDVRNAPARRLYERVGFRKTGVREAYIAPLGKG